jgi:hypothetical protein
MPTFLVEIDKKINSLLSKKNITKNDIIELKTFIIAAYENDTIIDIKQLKISQEVIINDLYNF